MKLSGAIRKRFCPCFAELLLLPTLSESSRQTEGKPEMQAKPVKPRSAQQGKAQQQRQQGLSISVSRSEVGERSGFRSGRLGDHPVARVSAGKRLSKGAPMSFGIYIVGYIILIVGLAMGAHLLHMPQKWIVVGIVCLVGMAIIHGVTATRQKDPPSN